MRLGAVVLLFVAACANGGGDDSITKERACTLLRDHLVDLRITPGEGLDVAAHRVAMERALGADFVDSCARSMSDEQVMCGVRALDNAAVAGCVSDAH